MFNVELDPGFISGEMNNDDYIDLKYLNQIQQSSLISFIDAIKLDKPLKGKNKQSWLDDDQNMLPNTQSYMEYNFWHYHCGPSYSNTRLKALTYNLQLNLNGLTSAEVIHYSKEGDVITIYGYSPTHTPFPKSDDSNNKSPFFS